MLLSSSSQSVTPPRFTNHSFVHKYLVIEPGVGNKPALRDVGSAAARVHAHSAHSARGVFGLYMHLTRRVLLVRMCGFCDFHANPA